MSWAHWLGVRGVLPRCWLLLTERLRGMGVPNGAGPTGWADGESCSGGGRCLRSAYRGWEPPAARAHRLGGPGVVPMQWLMPKKRLQGLRAPKKAGPLAEVTRRPSQVVVAVYGVPAGDGRPQRRGPTSWVDGQSCLGGGRCPWSAYGGCKPPTVQAHWLGRRGVLHTWWLLPMERLQGIGAPNGAAPLAAGRGKPTQAATATYGEPTGDGSPQGGGPSSCWLWESCPSSGRRPWCAYREWEPPTARLHWLGGGEVLTRGRPLPTKHLRGMESPTVQAHRLGGWGVMPRRRPLPVERLQGLGAPNGAAPLAGGRGSPALAAAAIYGAPTGDGSPQRLGTTGWGDWESCPGGGRYLHGAYGEWQPPTTWVHRVGGQGVLPRR